MEKLKLFSDHVLIKRIVEERTAGGLYLVGPGDVEAARGEVVACGDGKFSSKGVRIPMTVKAGDQVMYGTISGVPMDFNGDKCLMMHEADLLCVVE